MATGLPAQQPQLPHAFPFRFAERRADGGILVSLSGGASAHRGGGAYPPMLAIEIMAQAAILVLPQLGPPEEGGEEGSGDRGLGLLAGVDDARFEAPLEAGDQLLARAEMTGRFGRLMRVDGSLHRRSDGTPVATARLLLASG